MLEKINRLFYKHTEYHGKEPTQIVLGEIEYKKLLKSLNDFDKVNSIEKEKILGLEIIKTNQKSYLKVK